MSCPLLLRSQPPKCRAVAGGALPVTRETVVAFWAVLKANAVVSIVNPLTKSAKLQYQIDDCTPAALVTAIITERGVARAPYEDSLRQLAE